MNVKSLFSCLLVLLIAPWASAVENGCGLPFSVQIFRSGLTTGSTPLQAEQNAQSRCQETWDLIHNDPSLNVCGNFWITVHQGANGGNSYLFNCKYCGAGQTPGWSDVTNVPVDAGGASEIATATAQGAVLDMRLTPGDSDRPAKWIVGVVDHETGRTQDVVIDAQTGEAAVVDVPDDSGR